MREILTLQFGQCGNQVGKNFWSTLTAEHGLSPTGKQITKAELNDRKDIFFYQADDGNYVPRCVLIDLEPRVISDCGTLFNSENVYIHEGGGAGNNWAHGYAAGKEICTDVLDIVQREVEACDRLEAFTFMHSVAGGTGSGTGTFFMHQLRNIYPKKIIQAYSILPNNESVSDVVVQPYNTVLALERLNRYCDFVVVMDNGALGRTAVESVRIRTPTFTQINSLITTAMSASTATLRYPTYMFSDLYSIIATLADPDRKFVVPAFTPFSSPDFLIRKTTVGDIMRRLYLPKTRLATMQSHGRIIGALNILTGVSDYNELQRAILRAYDTQVMDPLSFHTVLTRHNEKMTGLSLVNATGFCGLLSKIAEQYDKLKKNNAFIEMYKRYMDISDFDVSREEVGKIIDSYSL